jgi:hypothetical protein
VSTHTQQSTRAVGEITVETLTTVIRTGREGRHHLGLLASLQRSASARDWHAVWCRLGDAMDEAGDIVIAWITIGLIAVATVAAGAVIGFAYGPVVAAAYVLAVIAAVALWVRSGRRKP